MSASEPTSSTANGARVSALFQTLVAQQVNMALVCMGQAPSESGQPTLDLEGARFFIDVLEMLDIKSKGNLTAQEQAALRQSLTSLRLAYVEIANAHAQRSQPAPPPPDNASPAAPPSPEAGESAAQPELPEDTESRKKFTKKY